MGKEEVVDEVIPAVNSLEVTSVVPFFKETRTFLQFQRLQINKKRIEINLMGSEE